MQMTEITYRDAVPIDSYGPGFFRVAGKVFEGSVLVTLTRTLTWGGLEDIQTLESLAKEVDVVFLGMGRDIAHAPVNLRTRLEAAGIGLEAMSSPAACRTYNVLASEGRRVAAALLPV